MLWKVLSCPQCSAPLPRQARWRMITCPFCRATVGLGQPPVEAASFREAWQRARNSVLAEPDRLDCGRSSFRLMSRLGTGPAGEHFFALRLLPTPAVVGLTVATGDDAAARLRREAEVLAALHRSEAPGAHAMTRRLPLVLGLAFSEGPHAPGQVVLALRHPPAAWGSLARLQERFPGGLPATHAVWIWRRILEILGFVHASGWAHGDLALANLWVHPHDHLVHLVGWSAALPLEAGRDPRRPTVVRDLAQSGWAIRSLLAGKTATAPPLAGAPAPLAALVRRVTEEPDYLSGRGARQLADEVGQAAREAFGPPLFVHLEIPG